MEKPNLERIAEVLELTWGIWGIFDLEYTILNVLKKTWANIVYYQNHKTEERMGDDIDYINGRIYVRKSKFISPWVYPEYEDLTDLLKDNNLEHLAHDFRFWAYLFVDSMRLKENKQDIRSGCVNKYRESRLELLLALKLLREHRNGISINFIRNQNICVRMANSNSIHIIEDALFEHLKNIDNQAIVNYCNDPLPYDDINRGDYLDLRIAQEKAMIKENKSRIKKDANYDIRDSVFNLWEYLQRFTPLKANDGCEYSNEQGRFIFRFLVIIGLIDNQKKIIKEEDVIGYYLNSYRKEISLLSKNTPSKT